MNELMTSAVRLHGANDIRLERFPLPEPGDDEALLKVVTDSLCASTYKAVIQGKKHKRTKRRCRARPTSASRTTST